MSGDVIQCRKEQKEEEINLFDLKSLNGEKVTRGQEANMHRGKSVYRNPKNFQNVFALKQKGIFIFSFCRSFY